MMIVRRPRVKTPTLLQMEAVECGAAALGIILSFYGRIVPLAELRRACGVSRDGSKASNMVKAARLYGLDAKGFKKELDSLRDMSVPFIVFWQFNHFLVVEGWNRQTVFLNDPATGPRQVSWQEFDEGFTGVVLCMEPGEAFVRGGRKPSLWLALGRQLTRSVSAWLYVVFIGFLLVLPGLVIPVFSQIFVDQILISNQQDWLRPLLLGLVMTTVLQAILRALQLGCLRDLKMKLMVAMNGQFLWHILRLPIRFYSQRFAGEISSRTALNTRVSDVIAGQLSSTVIDGGMLVFYGAVMLTYDWFLTLIGVGVAVVNLLVLQWVSRQRVDTNLRLNQDLGKLSGVEISGLQSIETLKATASESDFFSRWSGYYAKTINAQQDLTLASQRIGLLPPFLSSITTMLILVLGGLRVIDGHLSIGMLVAFQSLMASFQGPVQTLVGFGQQLQTLESDLYRLDDVLNNPIDEGLGRHGPSDSVELRPQLQGRLEFRNVTFGYSQVDAPLLENFNFVLEPGKRIALVGSSGSGKSTVAKLASGLYQPWTGEILLDDRPRLDYHPLTLVQSVAMVEQDIFLFGGTVSDNLSLWDPSVLPEDLTQACRDAEIHGVISAIPGGYAGTLLEAGADLSGGQRQRLEIARALVNHPSLLILDEATSALDAETEALIDQNLRQRGCACLIVAHRLSTIRDCDEIIVLHQGKVIEQGTHDELWASGGYYATLLKTEGETVAVPDQSVSGEAIPASVSVFADVWADAQRHQWTPHESISLSHESRLWRLRAGQVSIFACPSGLYSGAGGKRYLYTVTPSEQFCSLMALEESGWTLEAIASEPSDLDSLPLTARLPQQWLASLSAAVPSLARDYSLDQALLFYRDLSLGLDQLTADERQQRTQQLIQKARFNAEVTHEAFQSLASVLQSDSRPHVSRGSELMQAMGAIADRLKIPLQPIRLTDQGDANPVMAIAQAAQLRVRRVSLTPHWWRSDAGPLLGYLADQSPVALLPRGAGRYDVYNPRTQRRHRLTSRLAQSLDPTAYSFYRPFPQGKNQIALFQFALAGQWGTLFTTFLAGIGVTLLGMLIPQATGMLIDYAIPNADQRTIIHMGVGLAVVAIASTIFRLLQNLATMRLEAKGDSATQAALWDHLLKLKLDFYRQFSTGDLQSRVSAIRQIRQILSGTTLRTLISGLVAFLNLILLFVYNQSLAWVALGVTFLVVIATVIASLLIRGNILRQQQLSGELFGFVVQLINGIAKLRVAHAENRAFASWASRFTPLVRLSFFQQQVEDAIALFNAVIPSLANAVIFWLVVDLIQVDSTRGVAPMFTAGTYLAFNAAFGLLLSGATSLSNTLVNVLDVWILWGRVKPILEAEPEITPQMSDPGNLTGTIQIQGCTFRYRREGSPILDDINLSIGAGEFVAIVGPSGSGKSTLLRLLLGFESPESGSILYDGQDLQGLDVTAVRRQLGVVLQNSKINAASLYENISGNANMTLEAAFQAASRAGMAEDIAAMPMGMHTLVNEGGGNLSGGQRQRLIIARALAQEPRLLFFDEATSALDNRTQDIVTRSLNCLNITRVIIAHRLSTVRMADRIFVLDRGRVIQTGSFDELSRSPGLFQTLMNRQRL